MISNGYDPAFKRIDNVKIPDGCEDKVIVTSVGRLTEEKRQDLIIKAVAKSKYRDRISLFLAGKVRSKRNTRNLQKNSTLICT